MQLQLLHPTSLTDFSSRTQLILSQLQQLHSLGLQGSPITLADLSIKVSGLREALASLIATHAALEAEIKSVVMRNEASVLTGDNVINAVDAPEIASASAVAETIADVPVQPLLDSIFLSRQPKPLLGRKFFQGNLVVSGGHLVSPDVNDVNMRDVALVNRVNHLTGVTSFSRVEVLGHANLRSVGGIRLPTDLIPIDGSRTPASLQSPVLFAGSLFVQDLRFPLVDQVDLGLLAKQSLTKDGSQRVTSPLVISGPTLIAKSASVKRLNRIPLQPLVADVVRTDGPIDLARSSVTFSAPQLLVSSRGSLAVKGSLDHLSFPQDLLLTATPQRITSPSLHLKGHHTFSSLEVQGSVDGIRLPDQVVRLSDEADALPPVSLTRGADFFGSVTTTGKVDGVDLHLLKGISVKAGESRLSNPTFEGPVVLAGNLDVAGHVKGLKVRGVADDVVLRQPIGSKAPPVVRLTGWKRFTGSVGTLASLRSGSVNGWRLDQSFVSTRRAAVIEGRKIRFTSASFARISAPTSDVNGKIKLDQLMRTSIRLSSPGRVVGGKRFLHQLRVTSCLKTRGRVQGLVVGDIVRRSSPAGMTLLAPKTAAQRLEVDGELTVASHMQTRLLDQQNVTRLSILRVTLDSQQSFPSTELVLETSRAESLVTGRMADVAMPSFLSRILSGVVTGKLEFAAHVDAFTDVTSLKGVNEGTRLEQLDRLAV